MDDGIATKIFGGIATVISGVVMFGLNRHAKTLDAIRSDILRNEANTSETRAELAKHQLEVAQNYAKGTTIDRLHERLDSMDEKFDKKMDAVGADIKTILGMVK